MKGLFEVKPIDLILDIPIDHRRNLESLSLKLEDLQEAYGSKLQVTSGYRTIEKHLQIYKDKGITDKSVIPMKSKHLSGQAVDIYDPNKKLQSFLLKNKHVLEDLGLYCEDFNHTPNWVHIQTIAPGSGNRFFKP